MADGLAKAQPGDVLELGEVFGYVHKRRNKVWTWTALCRRTRQIVTYVNGDLPGALGQDTQALPQLPQFRGLLEGLRQRFF